MKKTELVVKFLFCIKIELSERNYLQFSSESFFLSQTLTSSCTSKLDNMKENMFNSAVTYI